MINTSNIKLGKNELASNFYEKYFQEGRVFEGEKDFYYSFFRFVFLTIKEEIIGGAINLHKLGSLILKKRVKKTSGQLETPYYVNMTFSKHLKESIKSEEFDDGNFSKNVNIIIASEEIINRTTKRILKDSESVSMNSIHRKVYSKNILMNALAFLVDEITSLIKQGYWVDLEVKYIYVQKNKKFGYVLGQRNNTAFIKSLNAKIIKDLNEY